ncbi:Glycosyl hydrolase family 20, domain 2 [Saccharicrinis carchari]|uniref:beta-N-acetylhexosaminidase n=1 Tax=Saccharicrinis carchari TaxID=1168039 RepID=A0A521ENM0_SACCC|nr:family 20 glycosylhydrolase [Saccharicrinis carchari]SMO85526.1 Glycosyl hydrolase family 20, domain 2 [Saccharicrinis carchari]
MKYKHTFILFIVFLLSFSPFMVVAESFPHLLPTPQKISYGSHWVTVADVSISSKKHKEQLASWIGDIGLNVKRKSKTKLRLNYVDRIQGTTVNQNEAYKLTVADGKINIEAVSEQGAYWAVQTLRQLLIAAADGFMLRECEVVDWPAFRVRGFMHDVGRGFLPFEELKKQIALLSQFKINVFHWHLTEDIGWRLQSKVYPELTDSSNFERLPGKYYTIEQAKELVKFCQEHQVLLIPEIDMPGHSAAFTRALGHDMQSPEGMQLLRPLIDEIGDIFADVPYLHIGTDEVRFSNPDFVPVMVAYIRAHGKKVISWNPGWNYKTGEIDMIQMWSSGGKLHPGIPAIDSRLHYINHYDTFADLVGLYHSSIAKAKQGSPDIAGSIVALWNDRHVDSVEEILATNSFYPSMLTLAESAWKGGREQYFYDRSLQIGAEGSADFTSFKNFEDRLLHYKHSTFKDEPFPYIRQTNVKWHITDAFPNGGDLASVFPPEEELKLQYEYEGNTYKTHQAIGAGIYLRHVWGTLIPAFYSDPKPNHTAYAYTWVYSPLKQEAGLQVRFQNYSRSEKDLPPPQGKWDYKESQIWLNDIALSPPVWDNDHAEKTNEIALRNENWEGQKPQLVTLQKGWNKILLKLPVGQFTTKEVRLVKWMFNAVLVTPDGNKALDNIVYSPKRDYRP